MEVMEIMLMEYKQDQVEELVDIHENKSLRHHSDQPKLLL